VRWPVRFPADFMRKRGGRGDAGPHRWRRGGMMTLLIGRGGIVVVTQGGSGGRGATSSVPRAEPHLGGAVVPTHGED
jgi:hypothetical protein